MTVGPLVDPDDVTQLIHPGIQGMHPQELEFWKLFMEQEAKENK